MRTTYILIDFENVQPDSFEGLDAEHFRILIFVGASQNTLSFPVAAAVQPLGLRAKYIKVAANGSNALDFHIAYYIGRLAIETPDAHFHIISGDKGFDPLIQHLKEGNISAERSGLIPGTQLPETLVATSPQGEKPIIIKPKKPVNTADRVAVVITKLKQRRTSRPRRLKSLSNTINELFRKSLTTGEISAVVKGLQAKQIIEISDQKIIYTDLVSAAA